MKPPLITLAEKAAIAAFAAFFPAVTGPSVDSNSNVTAFSVFFMVGLFGKR